MFFKLWNYLRGYVIIEICGFSAERFINLAINKGIVFRRLSRSKKGIYLCVSLKSFKRLKECSKKSKCRIKIIKRCGVPFFIYRNRKRYFFSLGIVMFIFLLYTLSSFIWQINIEGNTRINEAELLSFCREQGFKTGTYKKNIDTKELIRLMKNRFPDISWATIKIEGTLATVKIAEVVPEPEAEDTSKPCSIIARCDGIITSIITSKGTPAVKINDTVKKGDILVSGELVIKNDETGTLTEYVHSIADIKAKQWYNININIPLEYKEKLYTGNSQKSIGFKILENKLEPNFPKKKIYFKNYDTIVKEKQLSAGEAFPLPFSLLIKENREYTLVSKKRTEEEAKALAEKKLNTEIINRFSAESEIADKRLVFSKTDSELKLNALVVIIDNIGEIQYISNTEGSSSINGTGQNTNTE